MEPQIFIVAGEASGDTYGAELMKALRRLMPSVIFEGAGGPKMALEVGAMSRFDNWASEAAVVGLWDVLKKYGYFRAKFSALLEELTANSPAAVVLIDYPGFNLRLAKAIRKRKLPTKIFYFISPQVWAWNRGRIPKMARLLDLMICIFPFEKELYESSGLPTTFVGHPLVEKLLAPETRLQALPREKNLLGFFPGSRKKEVFHLFPTMLETARRVMASDETIRCEAAAATSEQAAVMQAMAEKVGVPITITAGKSYELMQQATFAFVCSGTATLEAACFGLPYALVYKAAWLTYAVARCVIRVPYLGIINILAGHAVVREFLQHEAYSDALAQEALEFLHAPEKCEHLSQSLKKVVENLDGHGAYDRAAKRMMEELLK